MTPFSKYDVLKAAREVLHDGGDPNPCKLGTYCPRCAISIAKTDLDEKHNIPVPDLGEFFVEIDSDAPLIGARELIGAKDQGEYHTKESAIALIDSILQEGNVSK